MGLHMGLSTALHKGQEIGSHVDGRQSCIGRLWLAQNKKNQNILIYLSGSKRCRHEFGNYSDQASWIWRHLVRQWRLVIGTRGRQWGILATDENRWCHGTRRWRKTGTTMSANQWSKLYDRSISNLRCNNLLPNKARQISKIKCYPI